MFKKNYLFTVDDLGKDVIITLEGEDEEVIKDLEEALKIDLITGCTGFYELDSYEDGVKEIETMSKIANKDDLETFDLEDDKVVKILEDFEYVDKKGNGIVVKKEDF